MIDTPEYSFWFWFVILNSILFLPRFLMDWQNSSFFPIDGLIKGTPFERFRFLSYRYNYDLFRASFDLAVFCFFLYLGIDFFSNSFGLHLLFFLVYFIGFIYLIYFNSFDKIYNIPPLFYSDRFLLLHGLKIAFSGFLIQTIFAITGIVLLGFGLYYATGELLVSLFSMNWNILSFLIFSAIIAMGVFSFTRYDYEQLPQQAVQSPIYSMLSNIRSSFLAKKSLSQFSIEKLKQHNIYEGITLTKKPNLFFIVLESYGRTLYDDEDFSERYAAKMKDYEQKLSDDDWAMTTALSVAPIVGGSSWLSYSSIMYGFRIANQGTYQALQTDPNIAEYQSWFRLFQQKGYKNYQLNSLGGFKDIKIPWDTYSRFYSVDEWIKYADLDYRGLHYGFGPSPPDQYALRFAEELIRKRAEEPFSLFFITQNSHSPFESPTQVVEDWRTLNVPTEKPKQSSKFFENPNKVAYLQAIDYQLDNLFDFIQKTGTDNDLFFVIGDHQPPVITDRNAAQETPVHIIAKNNFQDFINEFNNDGFENGLLTKTEKEPLLHEGLYSLFMRNITKHFSDTAEKDWPPYFPKGIPINNTAKENEKD